MAVKSHYAVECGYSLGCLKQWVTSFIPGRLMEVTISTEHSTLEKLKYTRLFENFNPLYAAVKFITLFTTPRHWILIRIQFISSRPIYLISCNIVLPTTRMSSKRSLSDFATKTPVNFFFFSYDACHKQRHEICSWYSAVYRRDKLVPVWTVLKSISRSETFSGLWCGTREIT